MISLIQRSGDWFEYSKVNNETHIENEPKRSEVIGLGSTVDNINDEEEGLKLGLQKSDDYEQFTEDVDKTFIGFVFMGEDGHYVEVNY